MKNATSPETEDQGYVNRLNTVINLLEVFVNGNFVAVLAAIPCV